MPASFNKLAKFNWGVWWVVWWGVFEWDTKENAFLTSVYEGWQV